MKLGIVGLPNVGKSTLFNSLTKAGAQAANFPFCTIDPNIGVVAVPDERIEKLGKLYNTKKVTPAVIEFVDIAGLVKGASKGEGLGNQFLANIREVDAIVQVGHGEAHLACVGVQVLAKHLLTQDVVNHSGEAAVAGVVKVDHRRGRVRISLAHFHP